MHDITGINHTIQLNNFTVQYFFLRSVVGQVKAKGFSELKIGLPHLCLSRGT